jgi:molybdate transport system substrate-binding protein
VAEHRFNQKTMSRSSKLTGGFWLALAVLLISCSKPAAQNAANPAATSPAILVSAAASTKDVLEALAAEFQKSSGVEVKINPGPSNGLTNQILSGAPADLFLSASQQWADEVQKGGHAEATAKLLTNRLALVVPKSNPAGVRESKDLLSSRVKKVALAGEKVPAGMYADQALTKLDLLKTLTDDGKIIRGQDVRTALTYVERGEAEAGFVYSTDVAVASNVVSVYEFDATLHDEIVYILVLLKHGSQNAAAREFYNFLQSPAADNTYNKFGFQRFPK